MGYMKKSTSAQPVSQRHQLLEKLNEVLHSCTYVSHVINTSL